MGTGRVVADPPRQRPPDAYLAAIHRAGCRHHAPLIMNEIWTGLRRSGKLLADCA